MISTLNFGDSPEAALSSTDPVQLYTREKKFLDERCVLPLVALPEYSGLRQNVRDWRPARSGEWPLADVWLDLREPRPAETGNSRFGGQIGTNPTSHRIEPRSFAPKTSTKNWTEWSAE